MSSKKSMKKRNWGCIIYPESAPADWFDILQQSGLSGAVSPLHDKDIDPDGEPKKAHYHVILTYPGPTTYNNVASFTHETLNGSLPKPLESIRGYYRYFTHLDHPD
ncbi:MAG: replication protein, partial [Ruminococcus sp.]|nr:replication protein [Ruminococcus sp.]